MIMKPVKVETADSDRRRGGVREARVQDRDRGGGAVALRRGRRRSHKAQRVTRVVFG
jgi:hypothetical protein